METIEVGRRDGIVTVTLNRPHRKNAMTPTMWEELLVVFAEVEANAADRVLVAIAARVGTTRLIDNAVLGEDTLPTAP